MSLYRKATDEELGHAVVTQAMVVMPVMVTVVTLDRKADRHKTSRAAYMRAYRAKQKAK